MAADQTHFLTNPTGRWLALVGGLAVIAGALTPSFDNAADRSFSMHMAQHVLMIDAAAPMIAIGWPTLFVARRAPRALAAAAFLARPAPAVVVSSAVLWFWHLPAAYNLALEHTDFHALEHLMFVGSFVLYWRPLLGDSATPAKLTSNESRVLYLIIGAISSGSLGALLTLSDHVIYAHYLTVACACGRPPLADQRLGGGVMWLSGALVSALVAVTTFQDDET